MRIVVFGASGRTGRLLTGQALDAGHQVIAVARQQGQVRPRAGLTTARADAMDPDAVSAAVADGDAVISVLGIRGYTTKPVDLYSAGTANIIAAMGKHGPRRLVVAGSAASDPGYRASDALAYRWVMKPLFMDLPGRTVYEDNRRMESLIRDSGLDATIVRACWLFNGADVTDYQVSAGSPHGMFTARADLAACLLAQLRHPGGDVVGVQTTVGTPSIPVQIWREVIRNG